MVITWIFPKEIAVVGLGLIGGSFCKTIKKNLGIACWGLDLDTSVAAQALAEETISRVITEKNCRKRILLLWHCILSRPFHLSPIMRQTFRKGALYWMSAVSKSAVVKTAEQLLSGQGYVLGTHPMAGREFSVTYMHWMICLTRRVLLSPHRDDRRKCFGSCDCLSRRNAF